jgi:hypothetical protein
MPGSKSAEVGEDEVVPHLVLLERRPVLLDEVRGLHGLFRHGHAGRACAERC